MSTTSPLSVLINGGGIAGNALALHLLRAGLRVTVLERAATPRPGGQAVDLRGPSREIVERMGLMPGIRDCQLDEHGMSYVDERGREYARMAVADFDGRGAVADIEITRGDLNQVLLDQIAAASGDLDYRYNEWAQSLEQDDTGVRVTFASGEHGRFDLVVGADGVHSAIRRMVFGPEEQFTEHLGGYMAFFTIPTPAEITPGWLNFHSIPKAAVVIRADVDPSTSKASVTMRLPADPALRGDLAVQHELVRTFIADAQWQAPAVLAAMPAAEDFYFDQLARVTMPSLSQGRVVLLGDAGYCGSPLTGMGTAMAFVGAYLLAGEITTTPDDLAGALVRHEAKLRPFLTKALELPGGGLKFMLPTSTLGVRMSRLSMRVMMSRALRPLTAKMFFDEQPYELPEYGILV